MTDRPDDDPVTAAREEREVADLLAEAGPRAQPPTEDLEAVLAAARFAWRRKLAARAQPPTRPEPPAREGASGRGPVAGRFTRRALAIVGSAIAAAVLVALGLRLSDAGDRSRPAGPTVATVATVEVVTGELELRGEDGWRTVGSGAAIPAGAELRTGSRGRAALRTSSGASLRADRSTRWSLGAADRIVLATGSLYVDTGAAGGLVIATPIGEARDVGTRFAVGLEGGEMRVGVRDGAVMVERGADRFRAEAGVELRVPSRGPPQRLEIATWGEPWSWVAEVAPPFELEGSTLAEFLAWLEAETGWRVEYDQRSVGEPAERIVLHGSLEGVSPHQAPALVLPGAEVSYRLEEGVLIIE